MLWIPTERTRQVMPYFCARVTGQKQGLCQELGHFVLLGCVAQYLRKVLGGRGPKIRGESCPHCLLDHLILKSLPQTESPRF